MYYFNDDIKKELANKLGKLYKPKELWDIFEAAYEICPQAQAMDEDSYEDGFNDLTYGEIRKSSTKNILNYWLSSNSIGGNILFNLHYYKYLEFDLNEMVKEIKER